MLFNKTLSDNECNNFYLFRKCKLNKSSIVNFLFGEFDKFSFGDSVFDDSVSDDSIEFI